MFLDKIALIIAFWPKYYDVGCMATVFFLMRELLKQHFMIYNRHNRKESSKKKLSWGLFMKHWINYEIWKNHYVKHNKYQLQGSVQLIFHVLSAKHHSTKFSTPLFERSWQSLLSRFCPWQAFIAGAILTCVWLCVFQGEGKLQKESIKVPPCN